MVVLCLKKIRGNFGPNPDVSPNYFCLQIYFLDCYSSVFFFILHISMDHKDQQIQVMLCRKNFRPTIRASGPNLVKKFGFCSQLGVNSYNSSDIAHSDLVRCFWPPQLGRLVLQIHSRSSVRPSVRSSVGSFVTSFPRNLIIGFL